MEDMGQQSLVVQPPAEVPSVQGDGAAMLAAILKAVQTPEFDVEKMQRIIEMKERFEAKEAEKSFNAALGRLQPQLPYITKDGQILNKNGGVQSRFATYEAIDKAIRPLLAAEKFSLSFDSQDSDDGKRTTYSGTLSHAAGHSRAAHLTLPADTSGNKNGIQAIGSTTQYAKRYLVKMLLNIVEEGEDNDGNSASYISEEDARKIEDMLYALGDTLEAHPNRDGFLKYMGAAKVREIQQRDLAKGIQALKAKLQKGAR